MCYPQKSLHVQTKSHWLEHFPYLLFRYSTKQASMPLVYYSHISPSFWSSIPMMTPSLIPVQASCFNNNIHTERAHRTIYIAFSHSHTCSSLSPSQITATQLKPLTFAQAPIEGLRLLIPSSFFWASLLTDNIRTACSIYPVKHDQSINAPPSCCTPKLYSQPNCSYFTSYQ